MKKRKPWVIVLLAVCTILLVWSVTQIHAIGNNLQYLVTAPVIDTSAGGQDIPPFDPQAESTQEKSPPNAKAQELLEDLQIIAEDWDGIIEAYSMSGIVESASFVSDTDVPIQTRLNTLGPNAFLIAPQYLLAGRLFYPEELEYGSHGILLDEQLALALFRITEPIGRTVTVSQVEFTVIGVLRHTKRVGDSNDYAAYVPMAALWNQAIQLDALQVTAKPVSGAGARATFNEDLESWYSGGTLINLQKEASGAQLPLWVLLCTSGSIVLFWLFGVWKRRLWRFVTENKQRLQQQYLRQFIWPLIGMALLFTITGGALVLIALLLLRAIVAPLYIFPEWVPAVPVVWNDIQTAFWQVWQGAANLMELRSPELIRIRYFGMVISWCSAITACLLFYLWGMLRKKRSKEQHK